MSPFPTVNERAGRFYAGREFYIFWSDCNQWTVRRLAAVGLADSVVPVIFKQQVAGRLSGFQGIADTSSRGPFSVSSTQNSVGRSVHKTPISLPRSINLADLVPHTTRPRGAAILTTTMPVVSRIPVVSGRAPRALPRPTLRYRS